MDLSNLTNILKKDYEKEIKDVISEVKKDYEALDTERTCMIYSSIIHDKLKERHIISRIIDTTDLGSYYAHRFVLAKAEEYYLIDLTYKQFFEEVPEEFKILEDDGYIKVDKVKISNYVKSIVGIEYKENIDNLFFK